LVCNGGRHAFSVGAVRLALFPSDDLRQREGSDHREHQRGGHRLEQRPDEKAGNDAYEPHP
jgi:hypothetical protein